MGIKLVNALPRHPTTGGRFERFGQEIKLRINGVLAEHPYLDIDQGIAMAISLYK